MYNSTVLLHNLSNMITFATAPLVSTPSVRKQETQTHNNDKY